MTIEQAIENLQTAKASGVKHIVLAYWEAGAFLMEEGDEWGDLADFLEDQMDWAHTHEDLLFHKNQGL